MSRTKFISSLSLISHYPLSRPCLALSQIYHITTTMQADSDPPTYTQMIYLLIGQLLNINFIVIESSVDDDDNNNDNANNVFQSREQF